MAANVCASKFVPKSSKARFRLAFSWTSLPIALRKPFDCLRPKKMKFLFSNTLSAAITAADVKAVVDSFLKPTSLVGRIFKYICTDGAPAMICVKSGFVTLMKNEWPHVTFSHCSLYRNTLAAKTLPIDLVKVMDVAIYVIIFICSRAKNRRFFHLLAKEIRAQHVRLLFYTKVRWQSRSKCLSRLY